MLFSDDAQKFLMLKQLNEKQQQLASRRQELANQLDQVKDTAASALEAYKAACKAVERRQREVWHT